MFVVKNGVRILPSFLKDTNTTHPLFLAIELECLPVLHDMCRHSVVVRSSCRRRCHALISLFILVRTFLQTCPFLALYEPCVSLE